MTLFIAQYTDRRSNNGRGESIVAIEDMPRMVAMYPDVEFRLYSPESTNPTNPVDNCIHKGRASYGHTFPGFCTADSCY